MNFPTPRIPSSRTMRAVGWSLLAVAMMFDLPPDATAGSVPGAFLQLTAMEDQRISGPEILPFLSDPDPAVRGRAALALGRIGRAEDVPALIPLLRDQVPEVRQWAAFALGEIEDSTAAIPLAGLLDEGKETDAQVRALAVEGLGKLRARPDVCRKALHDAATEVRLAALLAAWKIPVPQIAEEILRFTSDPDAETRWVASYCLMRLLGAPPSGRTAIPPAPQLEEAERARAEERLRSLTMDADARVRLQAARGLASAGDSASTRVLLDLAADPDWRVRVEAVRALAAAPQGHPARPVTMTALGPFLNGMNPNVRIAALEALATLGRPQDVLPRLRGFLGDSRARVREVAFGSMLARYQAEGTPLPKPAADAVEALSREMLGQKDWTLRILAADGAALLPMDAALPILETLARDDPRVAKAAVEPLLKVRAGTGAGLLSRLRPDLDSFLAASDPVLRSMAVGAAGSLVADSSLGAAEADWTEFEQLLRHVRQASLERDGDADVRLAVAEAAASRLARPAMRRLLDESCADPDYLVRRAASEALRQSGETPVRAPEPVETGRAAEDYIPILEWAEKDHWAVIETEGGSFTIRLFSREAPLTCWNFAGLAGSGFFDRGRWHRVVPDFVLQDGCSRGDGYGGSNRAIRCEINRQRFSAGTLGMALSGKDTGTSQFFLTHSEQPHLDGRYTVFGRIETGRQVAEAVIQGSPIQSIRVVDERP